MNGKEFRNKFLQMLATVELGSNEIVRSIVVTEKLTLYQASILFILENNHCLSIGSISKMMNAASSNISATCRKLQEKDLLIRERQAEDERVTVVRLSEKGKQVLQRLNEKFSCYDKVLEEFPEEKLQFALDGYKEFVELLNLLRKKGEL